MQATATGPRVPGLTAPAPYERGDLPDIEEALAAGDEAQSQEDADKAVGGALLNLVRRAFDAWKWYHDECRQTAAMLAGFQHGYWDEGTGQFCATPESDDRDNFMVVCNLEQAIVQQAVGILVQGDPIFGTYPGTSETGDAAASETGDLLCRSLWRTDGMGKMLKRAAKGAFCYGITPVLEEWDACDGAPYVAGLEQPGEPPDAGGPGAVATSAAPDEPDPAAVGGAAAPQPTAPGAAPFQPGPPVIRFKGKTRTTVLQRDQVAFDPVASLPYDGAFFVIKERVSRSKAVEQYPGKVTRRSSPVDPDAGRSERNAERWSSATKRLGTEDERNQDGVTVYRVYVKRTPARPFGAEIRLLEDGTIVMRGVNPAYPSWARIQAGEQWPNYDWPVFFYCGDERENCPFGRGRMLDAHEPQKEFNGLLGSTVAHHAVIAKTKIVVHNDVEVDWDDEIGQMISLSPRSATDAVRYLSPPDVPQSAIPLMREIQGHMEYVTGVNAASNGQPSDSGQSGRALGELQTRDSVRLDTIKTDLYRTVALHMEFKLSLFREYADQKRMISVVGENERVACRMLDKTSIAGGTHVVVFNDTSLPSDPSKRILALSTFVTTYSQAPDERMKNALLQLVGLHDFNGLFRAINPDLVRAKRMTRRLLLGEKPQPMPWDNPMIFKAAFDEFMDEEQVEARIEAEGGIAPDMTPDPMTGQPSGKFAAAGPFGQACLALWQRYTDLATPPAPQPKVVLTGPLNPTEVAAQLGEKPPAAPPAGPSAPSAPPQAAAPTSARPAAPPNPMAKAA